MPPDCKAVKINWDQIKTISKPQQNGFTSTELAAHLGITQGAAQKQLKNMVAAGKVRYVGKRAGVRVDGVACLMPEYQIIEEKRRK